MEVYTEIEPPMRSLPEEAERKLLSAGIQATPQRIAICRYVLEEADHPTAEEIKSWVDRNFPGISLATVYNTLKMLVRCGLLRELKLAECGKVIYDANVTPHPHFFDEVACLLFDLPPDAVGVRLGLEPDLEVTGVEVIVRGRRRRAGPPAGPA